MQNQSNANQIKPMANSGLLSGILVSGWHHADGLKLGGHLKRMTGLECPRRLIELVVQQPVRLQGGTDLEVQVQVLQPKG